MVKLILCHKFDLLFFSKRKLNTIIIPVDNAIMSVHITISSEGHTIALSHPLPLSVCMLYYPEAKLRGDAGGFCLTAFAQDWYRSEIDWANSSLRGCRDEAVNLLNHILEADSH